MIRISLLFVCVFILHASCKPQDAQPQAFTHQDTLRGSITPERKWWDVVKYNITVEPDFNTKSIKGSNVISFKKVAAGSRMQIDLQSPMEITSVKLGTRSLNATRNGNVYYVDFPAAMLSDKINHLTVSFSGKPKEAVNPPWDGGWIWKKDGFGNPWMSVACQGIGASVWYPCKDHQSDEPDSASITMIVPDTLVAVANGRMRSFKRMNRKTSTTWAVVNPINSYNIIPYIGKYVSWSEKYKGEKGPLDVSYWVLEENVEKAKKQFPQTIKMLSCFEHWFGPYPFYEDGFKLVESPHLGMEHQSAIAYGNGFANGYLGKDISGSGWGEKFDFIIVHESGHEWFANSITTKDIADMWVHEGFTNYSEVIFTTCEYGLAAGNEYAIGLRKNITNDKPLIGPYGVNAEGSVDMYSKGSNLVHTIRQIINDDEKFRDLLRSMNRDFYHRTVTSAEIEAYIIKKTGKDLTKVFDQYLRTTQVPVFEYTISGKKLKYRWTNCIEGFNMPLRIHAGKNIWINPTTQWKEMDIETSVVKPDPNFYIGTKEM